MAADPNMRCVCGYRRFRESIRTAEEPVQRWLRYETAAESGFGSTPFGLLFGSGSGGAWGLFELDVQRTRKQLACESCGRARIDQVIGGLGVFGSYVLGDYVFAVVESAALLSCLRIRFETAGETIDVTPLPYGGTTLPIELEDPIETASSPPGGAVLAAAISVEIPSVTVGGEYVVSLVDVCVGGEIELMTLTFSVSLESALLLEDGGTLLLEDGGRLLLG